MKKITLHTVIAKQAFTLMELMIVIVIIGILATVGMVMFGGQAEKAKIASTKANHKSLCKYVAVEAQMCQMGQDKIFEGEISCSAISTKYNSGGNPMGDITQALVRAMAGNFKNPYGAVSALGEDAVTSSGWGKARDLGYTIVDPQGGSGGKIGRLHIHTSTELPCTGDYKQNLSYTEYCPVDFWP